MLEFLNPAEYDRAELEGAENLPNRIIECSQTEAFTLLGYPTRVHSVQAVWRFADVMQEGRLRQTFLDYLGDRITMDEFEICREIVKIVWKLSSENYTRPVLARDCLARALVVFRHIQYLFPKGTTILEIGGGSGYLGALLVLAGYRYISTDICQGFYLFQNHLLQACTSGRLIELVTEERDVSDIGEIPAGSALHIPWWKWTRNYPKFSLAADVVSANHCLCEMHPRSMAYNVKVAAAMMRAAGENSVFIFESWGWEYHPTWTVAKAFAENGLGVGYIDPTIAAFVAADGPMIALQLPSVPPENSSPEAMEAAFRLPERLPNTCPLSLKITKGRAESASRAHFSADDFDNMLKEISGRENTQSEDERFFEYINQPHAVVLPRGKT
jgi:hypothetical protein